MAREVAAGQLAREEEVLTDDNGGQMGVAREVRQPSAAGGLC